MKPMLRTIVPPIFSVFALLFLSFLFTKTTGFNGFPIVVIIVGIGLSTFIYSTLNQFILGLIRRRQHPEATPEELQIEEFFEAGLTEEDLKKIAAYYANRQRLQ